MSTANGGNSEGLRFKAGVVGIWLAIAAVIAVLVWHVVLVSSLRAEVKTQAAQGEQAVASAEKTGAVWTAEALAAALDPLIYDRPEGDSETLQAVCESVVRNEQINLVVVTDPSGLVLASSDANLLNQNFPKMADQKGTEEQEDDAWVVVRPVMHGPIHVGTVRVRVQ